MRQFIVFFCIALACALPAVAHGKVRAFACEPEWAALLEEVGGNQVKVYQATSPKQDPHRVEARPSLIARMRRADLIVCSGSDLEIGWLPTLLTGSRNGNIQVGGKGHLDCSQFVRVLEVPTSKVDRSMGDVHPRGNPHYMYDPREAAKVARGLAKRMAGLDPTNAATYTANARAFADRVAAF